MNVLIEAAVKLVEIAVEATVKIIQASAEHTAEEKAKLINDLKGRLELGAAKVAAVTFKDV